MTAPRRWTVAIALTMAGLPAALGACGDDATVAPTPTAGTTASTSTATTGGTGSPNPPSPPAIPTNPPLDPVTLTHAVSRFSIGVDAADVWKQAYAIDGLKFSDPDDTTHCQLRPGAKKKDVVIDGPKGEDNSFGKSIVPILIGLNPDAEEKLNARIEAGEADLVLRIDDVGTNASSALSTSELFSVVGLAQGDAWQPSPELLDAVDADGTLHSNARFVGGYIDNNLWVSSEKRSAGRVALPIWDGFSPVSVHRMVVTLKLAPDRSTGTQGIFSGVVDVDEVVGAVRAFAGKMSPSLCDGTTLDNVVIQVAGAADMMKTGVQRSDSVCDGISVGLGFETRASKLGAPTTAGTPNYACPTP